MIETWSVGANPKINDVVRCNIYDGHGTNEPSLDLKETAIAHHVMGQNGQPFEHALNSG